MVMTLVVHTANIGYPGRGEPVDPGRLDITRKSADVDGMAFAPSWRIVEPVLEMRRAADPTLAYHEAWRDYETAYRAEMRASFRSHFGVWDALLARSRVVLVCYCTYTDHQYCHRTLLARDILTRLGAQYGGEIEVVQRQVEMPLGGSK
jgi:uncharacterized protein YeaO (DUF488 family)